MVVLLPMLPGERSKCCSRCQHIGLGSPELCRSSFYPRRDTGHYRSECRRCSTQEAGERRTRRYKRDPAIAAAAAATQRHRQALWTANNLERRREQTRRSRAHRKARDPEWTVRQREIQRRYKEKLYGDPERLRAARERDRINYRLRRERKGKPVKAATARAIRSGVRFPIAPYREWLLGLISEESRRHGPGEGRRRVAARLDVSERRLHDYLHVWTEVDETVVDRACSREGSIMVHDLYPKGAATKVKATRIQLVPPLRPRLYCATPGCDKKPVKDGRFCPKHDAVLARVRSEYEKEGAWMSSNGGASRRTTKTKSSGKIPTCCAPHCWNPRLTGRRFCDECEAAGRSEEDYQ